MKLQVIFLFVLISSSYCFAQDEPAKDSTSDDHAVEKPVPATQQHPDFNDRLDAIIKDTIKKHMNEIDPLALDERMLSFNKTIGVGILERNVTGKAGFTNITLDGLMNIRRIGNAYLARTKYGNIEMNIKLALGPLNLKMDGIASLLGFGAKMKAEGKLTHVDGAAVLHFYPPKEEIYVKNFTLGNLNGLSIKITKSPLFFTPFIVNQVVRASIATFNPVIKTAAEKAGSRILADVVKESTFLKDIMTSYAAK